MGMWVIWVKGEIRPGGAVEGDQVWKGEDGVLDGEGGELVGWLIGGVKRGKSAERDLQCIEQISR